MRGPIISSLSDRHRGPRGRRIPFLIWSTPIAALSIVAMAGGPLLGRWTHGLLGERSPGVNTLVIAWVALLWLIFDVATTIANSVFSALINDVVPGQLIGRFFGLFRKVSLTVGAVLNFWVFGYAETHFTEIFVGVGVVYGVGFTWMCTRVQEGEYPPPLPRPVTVRGASLLRYAMLNIVGYFKICFSNSHYRWIFLTSVATLAFLPINMFSVFYAKSLQIPLDRHFKYMAVSYIISIALSYFVGVLADRYHPLRLAIVLMGVYVGVAFWGWSSIASEWTFAVAFIAHVVVSASFYTATASIGMRLFPSSRFAQLASASGMLFSLAMVVVSWAIGFSLDHLDHNYRHTFLMSACGGALGLIPFIKVFRSFKRLGGDQSYVAPE